jgi:hypothetical protein
MRPRFTGNIALALAGAVVRRDRTRGRAKRIAHELKTERVVQVFEAIFAEARNDRRVAVR